MRVACFDSPANPINTVTRFVRANAIAGRGGIARSRAPRGTVRTDFTPVVFVIP